MIRLGIIVRVEVNSRSSVIPHRWGSSIRYKIPDFTGMTFQRIFVTVSPTQKIHPDKEMEFHYF